MARLIHGNASSGGGEVGIGEVGAAMSINNDIIHIHQPAELRTSGELGNGAGSKVDLEESPIAMITGNKGSAIGTEREAVGLDALVEPGFHSPIGQGAVDSGTMDIAK
jgi:hypothetical protein